MYKNAIDESQCAITCNYMTNKIELSLPDFPTPGWRVQPVFTPPKIDMDTILDYQPGRTPPNIELHMKWQGEEEPREEDVKIDVDIDGGVVKSLTIFCRPCISATSVTVPEMNPTQPMAIAVQQPLPSRSDRPTLPQLQCMPTQSGEDIRIIESIGIKYRSLGTDLLNDPTGAVISAIRNEHHHQPCEITYAILSKWLQGKGKYPKTWETLISVLNSIQLSVLASDIEKTCQIHSFFVTSLYC